MKWIYLDHNIYIDCLSNPSLLKMIENRERKKIGIVYSPAHIEEIFRVVKNPESPFSGLKKGMFDIISAITDNNETYPTRSGVELAVESPDQCYKRVSDHDTTQQVQQNSTEKFQQNKAFFRRELSLDKNAMNLSNSSENEIWNQPIVSAQIAKFNDQAKDWVKSYNENKAFLPVELQDGFLPISFGFRLMRGSFESLRRSFADLQTAMELLFNLLNLVGYFSEKKEKKELSAIHDVSHAIYATFCDFLLTKDKRFYKKCLAVYSYLGVPTKMVFIDASDSGEEAIIDVFQRCILSKEDIKNINFLLS